MRCIKNLRIKIRFDVVASRGVMRCRFFNVVITKTLNGVQNLVTSAKLPQKSHPWANRQREREAVGPSTLSLSLSRNSRKRGVHETQTQKREREQASSHACANEYCFGDSKIYTEVFLVYNFILRAACLAVTRDFGSGSHSERTISHMFASSSKSKSHFCFENRAPETLPPSADLHFCKSLSYFVMSSVRNCFIFFASCK